MKLTEKSSVMYFLPFSSVVYWLLPGSRGGTGHDMLKASARSGRKATCTSREGTSGTDCTTLGQPEQARADSEAIAQQPRS